MKYVFILSLFFLSCTATQEKNVTPDIAGKATNEDKLSASEVKVHIDEDDYRLSLINPKGTTIETRFLLPEGFERISVSPASYGNYLRKLPLKEHGAEVYYYNGNIKKNNYIYDAVVDLKIGKRDLHQCADAIIRLRSEYLWEQEQYNKIHFNFTNGFRVDYAEWMKGKRIAVNGNRTSWVQKTEPSNSYEDLWKYLEIIFSYAGTLSLSKELKPVSINEIQIGDVFIQGGSPGHAVVIVDVAEQRETKEKLFLLAQSYMPAQEIQILKNPDNQDVSPWYSANFQEVLRTPEWNFLIHDLKRFNE